MKCLLCCEPITDDVAVFTKACRHVFCLACSEEKFNDQLVCPLCDTVLPKDGTQRINLKLDDADLLKVSESAFGMQPKQLCTILQNGLDFWAQQQRNEGAIHLQALDKMKDDLKEEKSLNRKLSMNLEGERRKLEALLEEKAELIGQYEELEKRYEEKSRDFRKLGESYKEMRKVHKRLQSDIRETHLPSGMVLGDSMHEPPEEDMIENAEEGRDGPYDFQVRIKGEGERRDGRKEAKTRRRRNRDGQKG